ARRVGDARHLPQLADRLSELEVHEVLGFNPFPFLSALVCQLERRAYRFDQAGAKEVSDAVLYLWRAGDVVVVGVSHPDQIRDWVGELSGGKWVRYGYEYPCVNEVVIGSVGTHHRVIRADARALQAARIQSASKSSDNGL